MPRSIGDRSPSSEEQQLLLETRSHRASLRSKSDSLGGIPATATKSSGSRVASESKARWQQFLNVVYLVVFLFSGPSLIMTNKRILRDIGFEFPISLTCFTLTVASTLCVIVVKVFKVHLPHAALITPSFYVKNVLPIGALSAGTIVFGMSSYLYLTVSFVQMVKAFTPVMTMIFVALFGLGYPSRKTAGCVVLICCGTAIAGAGEINFVAWGVFLMLFAQMCEALKLVYTQKILQNFRFEVIETLYFVTPISAVWVFLAALALEVPYMTNDTLALFRDNIGTFAMAGVFAFTTNLVNAFVIQISSALTLKLVATARNAALVMFNTFVLMEVVTTTQFVGYSISISAFVLYNYLKHTERQQQSSS